MNLRTVPWYNGAMDDNNSSVRYYTTCSAYVTPNGVKAGEVGSRFVLRVHAVARHPRKAEDAAMVKMLNELDAFGVGNLSQ